ncbi:hypothetical protein [Embleya sp. NPDC020886]|uniref:hypothetical protein n=1 Tax=Embleya sp. NPDC020886 TaxID=3363980 RepID=UPI0037BBF2F8
MRSRRDSGAVYRVRSPPGHEATLFSRYADVRAVHGRAARLRLDAMCPLPGSAAEGVDDESMKHRRAGRLPMPDPPERTRRRLLTATFTVRRAQAPAPRFQGIVDEYLDAMAAAGPPATSPAPAARTRLSATESTTASARRRRASNYSRLLRRCCGGYPGCASPIPPSPPTSSTAC